MKKRHCIYCILSLMYILGNHNGHLALWTGDTVQPEKIFPVKVETLPKLDQYMLNEGIFVRDEKKLNALLEDYLS